MKDLDNEYLLKLYEVYEGEFHIYLVFELLKGGELFKAIVKQKGIFLENEIAIIIKKILLGLNVMHKKGIMHRDIKPENLILRNIDNLQDIVIADFGLSEYKNKTNLLYVRCGTPGYVAPEILNDEPYDTKVDIFSTGIIFYILLTGICPFYHENYQKIIEKNQLCVINFNFDKNKKISSFALNLLRNMLQKNPKLRPTAEECLNHPYFEDSFNEFQIPQEINHLTESILNLNLNWMINSQKITGVIDKSIESSKTNRYSEMATPIKLKKN